tara:strand:+ start:6344 stop:6727 length:384 start_codon:yes stop_codon:yes gene_type:complete
MLATARRLALGASKIRANAATSTSTARFSASDHGDDARNMRPMPEGTTPIVKEHMKTPDDALLRERRALALRSWLESELGEERTALMTVLAKHRVQIPGGGEEAKRLLNELLEWKGHGVVEAATKDS